MAYHRLDVLIYAHDGRGLGHASRSIAIGMAFRRLFPERRVLFVSGCRQSQDLMGRCPLDWVKLPSYETQVIEGKSRGVVGRSRFTDQELGEIRSKHLLGLMEIYHPKVVLVDHSPQGKHKELLPAIKHARKYDTKWVLGLRGVVGHVPQLGSVLAKETFTDFYSGLLWYGDSGVLGAGHKTEIGTIFGCEPYECGYVSRLNESRFWMPSGGKEADAAGRLAGTISIPWQDEDGLQFLEKLSAALSSLPMDLGGWHLYLGDNGEHAVSGTINNMFRGNRNCRLMPVGNGYFDSLLVSNSCLICGGYNSITDVIAAGVPALVVLRNMQDREQQIHVERLSKHLGINLLPLSPATITIETLTDLLYLKARQENYKPQGMHFAGAETAAEYLVRCLT